MTRKNWTRNELIVAFNLYCRIPFGRIHNRNPAIIALAKALGRTPSALSWKLANFARLDPAVTKRKLSGATHGSGLEEEIWKEFSDDWDRLALESELLRANLLGKPVEEEASNLPEGQNREVSVMVRVNQGFFRAAILAAYDSKCCITGLALQELLHASHIVPWRTDAKNRTNPRNGLCLNALHDKAFDCGLIAVDDDFRVRVSPKVLRSPEKSNEIVSRYEGVPIAMPRHFPPEQSFLKYHRQVVFQA